MFKCRNRQGLMFACNALAGIHHWFYVSTMVQFFFCLISHLGNFAWFWVMIHGFNFVSRRTEKVQLESTYTWPTRRQASFFSQRFGALCWFRVANDAAGFSAARPKKCNSISRKRMKGSNESSLSTERRLECHQATPLLLTDQSKFLCKHCSKL